MSGNGAWGPRGRGALAGNGIGGRGGGGYGRGGGPRPPTRGGHGGGPPNGQSPQEFPTLGIQNLNLGGGGQPQPVQGQHEGGNGRPVPAGNGNVAGGGAGRGGGRGGGGVGARRGEREPRERPTLAEQYDSVITRPEALSSKVTTLANSKPIKLITNYFRLKTSPSWSLYKYHVDFSPEQELTTVKKGLLRPHGPILGAHIYDGTNLYTAHRIQPDPLEVISEKRFDNSMVTLKIRLVGELTPGDPTYLQFYNIIIRKCLEGLNLEEIGRNYFDPNAKIQFNELRLELWPGYKTSLRNHENDLLLCVDVAYKVIRMDTVYSIISEMARIRGGRGLDGRNLSDEERSRIKDELCGSIIMTHYNKRTYRIDDIDWNQNPGTTFDCKGSQKSLAQYYQDKYGLRVQEMRQPLIVSRPSKKDMHRGLSENVLLIPEFCQMTGLDERIRSDFRAMERLDFHFHQNPGVRMENVRGFMNRLRSVPAIHEQLSSWGLEFESELTQLSPPGVKVAAFSKDPTKIPYANDNQIIMRRGQNTSTLFPDDKADWSFALRDNQMHVSCHLNQWAIVVHGRDDFAIPEMLKAFRQVGAPAKLDFRLQDPLEVVRVQDIYPSSFVQAIERTMDKYGKRLQLLLIILPNNKVDLYSAIKRVCCNSYGIPSQCFQIRHFKGPRGLNLSVATKVVVQMNAKLGGQPWGIYNPFEKQELMVVGFDVHHSGKGKNKRSVGAMVATTNSSLTRYYSTFSFHQGRDELAKNMELNITKCVQAYASANNGKLPLRIMFYRDGVGDGQLFFVNNTELVQIKGALANIYQGKDLPKLTFIVVTKRILTRFFYEDRGVIKNPPPGTIVDDVVTLPERWDFFLVAQHSNKGTVSPTSFNVLYDNSGLNPGHAQRFTYKLCHTYYNWSGTVAVPGVVQYAHRLAYLTGIALGETARNPEQMAHQLWYL